MSLATGGLLKTTIDSHRYSAASYRWWMVRTSVFFNNDHLCGSIVVQQGPLAKVGWRDALWIGWKSGQENIRWELIAFDRDKHPVIEAKGCESRRYGGPSAAELDRAS